MQTHQLPFEIFEEIVETAGLWLAEAGEPVEDYDGVSLRKDYSGRGYTSGFGIVVEGSSAFPRFLVAAGRVASRRDMDGLESFDDKSLAEAAATDAMGRSGTIIYWDGWELTGVPDRYHGETLPWWNRKYDIRIQKIWDKRYSYEAWEVHTPETLEHKLRQKAVDAFLSEHGIRTYEMRGALRKKVDEDPLAFVNLLKEWAGEETI